MSHDPEYPELELEEMIAEAVSEDTEVAEATLVVTTIGTVGDVRILEVETGPSALLGCLSIWTAAAPLAALSVLQPEPAHGIARSCTKVAKLKAA